MQFDIITYVSITEVHIHTYVCVCAPAGPFQFMEDNKLNDRVVLIVRRRRPFHCRHRRRRCRRYPHRCCCRRYGRGHRSC